MNHWTVNTYAYHRRWYWKYMAVSYLCSFSAGWIVLNGRYLSAFLMFVCGLVLAFTAGMHASAAARCK